MSKTEAERQEAETRFSAAPAGFLRTHPYAVVLVGACAFSALNGLNDSALLSADEIEWHDTVAQGFIAVTMVGWVAISQRTRTRPKTYGPFFLGCACLIWLMTIKFFGELFEWQTSILTTFELLLAVAGLLLVTAGLLSWSSEFQYAIEQLSMSTSKYRALSEQDPLTGLLNQRRFDAITERLMELERDVSLILLDLDHFKSVNDEFGHPVGDRVIERTAELLSARLRATDFAFRMGGEEFALLYVRCPLELVEERAELVRASLASERFETEDGRAFEVTASLGVAHLGEDEDPSMLYHRADAALYQAKDGGRDRVVVAPS